MSKYFLPMFLMACGTTVSTAKQALTASMNFQTAMAEEFWKWDSIHQGDVLDNFCIPEKGEASRECTDRVGAASALKDYRAKRDKVAVAFRNARAVTVLGASLIGLAELGVKQEADLQNWLIALYQTSKDVRQALLDLGVMGTP